jgi:hypothetical protein
LSLLVFAFNFVAFAQPAADSVRAASITNDSVRPTDYSALNNSQSILLLSQKQITQDVEQYHASNKSAGVFILLMLMLASLTYLKMAFGNDMEGLLQSVTNASLAQQIFRTQQAEFSFSSIILNLNFVVAISLFVQFILSVYFHVSSALNISSILSIIFLFTFFYVAKIVALKLIGIMFEIRSECDEYIFNFTVICKTLGLALLPALFVFYTAPGKFFTFTFAITALLCSVFVAIFVWRGLSTGYKILYRSVYHFFIYVCVVEISPIFLLFKLLTKTII